MMIKFTRTRYGFYLRAFGWVAHFTLVRAKLDQGKAPNPPTQ
jgi:hypothetical protein